jgi:1-acyl-sn-glycerol-3-phosphate acyltransferase
MSGLKGGIASVILFCNILVIFSAMMPFALVKLLVPLPFVRRTMDRVLNALAQSWIAINGWWIALMQRVIWRVTGLETLRDKDWYLVSSNHQTWVDILVLQKVFAGRIPFLKFFLKRELMYVPFMGLAWWALDFPFMRRSGGGRSFAKDLAATRKSCERFRMIPTSVINFLEGTRLTAAKHAAQNSPYRHLLKPKVGGLAMALAVMGDRFNSYLDVTIVYPKGVPRFWDLLCGRMEEVVVRVCEVKIPQALVTGSYDADADYRRQLQDWIQQMWVEKDGYIAEVLANTPNRSPAIS